MADVPIERQPGEQSEAHEHSDVPIRPIVVGGAVIVGVIVVTFIGMFVVFRVYERQREAVEQPVSSVRAESPRQTNPDIPKLQGVHGFHDNTPAQDMDELRVREATLLNSYGQGADPGTARIPVTRAMDLVIDRKLLKSQQPATQPAATQSAGATTTGGTHGF